MRSWRCMSPHPGLSADDQAPTMACAKYSLQAARKALQLRWVSTLECAASSACACHRSKRAPPALSLHATGSHATESNTNSDNLCAMTVLNQLPGGEAVRVHRFRCVAIQQRFKTSASKNWAACIPRCQRALNTPRYRVTKIHPVERSTRALLRCARACSKVTEHPLAHELYHPEQNPSCEVIGTTLWLGPTSLPRWLLIALDEVHVTSWIG
jgi:hypothetical protein